VFPEALTCPGLDGSTWDLGPVLYDHFFFRDEESDIECAQILGGGEAITFFARQKLGTADIAETPIDRFAAATATFNGGQGGVTTITEDFGGAGFAQFVFCTPPGVPAQGTDLEVVPFSGGLGIAPGNLLCGRVTE
jgi:hypothetical protein